MKKHNVVICSSFLMIFFALYGSVVSAAESMTDEVEVVIKQYLHYFDERNATAMASLTTPELVVVDYGQRLNREEWDWYMSMDEEVETIGVDQGKEMDIDPIKTWDFDTRVVAGDVAYSNFKQAWTSNPDFVEASMMVLRRIEGKWLIDRWSIHEGEVWYKWLHDRIRAQDGKVEANWYELYKKERAIEVEPKYN